MGVLPDSLTTLQQIGKNFPYVGSPVDFGLVSRSPVPISHTRMANGIDESGAGHPSPAGAAEARGWLFKGVTLCLVEEEKERYYVEDSDSPTLCSES